MAASPRLSQTPKSSCSSRYSSGWVLGFFGGVFGWWGVLGVCFHQLHHHHLHPTYCQHHHTNHTTSHHTNHITSHHTKYTNRTTPTTPHHTNHPNHTNYTHHTTQALESYTDLNLIEAIIMSLTRLQPLLKSVPFTHPFFFLFPFFVSSIFLSILSFNNPSIFPSNQPTLNLLIFKSSNPLLPPPLIHPFTPPLQDSMIHKYLFWVAISVLQLDEISLYAAGLALLEQNLHMLDSLGTFEKQVGGGECVCVEKGECVERGGG